MTLQIYNANNNTGHFYPLFLSRLMIFIFALLIKMISNHSFSSVNNSLEESFLLINILFTKTEPLCVHPAHYKR